MAKKNFIYNVHFLIIEDCDPRHENYPFSLKKDAEKFFKEKVKSTTFTYKIDEDTDSILVKMCFYTELGTYLKSDVQKTKVYFKTSKIPSLQSLNFFPVFNTLPTVAYRKNHLGINVLNPSTSDKSDAIIIIGETSGRNKIYFQPAGESLCVIENFHIDGGTW